jgi:uncharacterized cupredoxin-like copper-binding protein
MSKTDFQVEALRRRSVNGTIVHPKELHMNALIGSSKFTLLGASLVTTMIICAGPSARADEVVAVTLADKGMESMHMDLSANEIKTGKVTFNVTNTSQNLVHEFVVAKPDKPIELLPYDEGKREVKEDAIGVVNEIENIGPGRSGALTLNLEPGRYILLCNIAGHFKAGMLNHVTVVE